MEKKLEQRRKEFRSSFEDSRREREEQHVQIRKAGRDENLAKRRSQVVSQCDQPDSLGHCNVAELVAQLQSEDIQVKDEACRKLRKVLSRPKPPIDEVIGYGAIPFLITFLQTAELPKLQFEATWAITNILSGTTEQTAAVVRHNAIPILMHQLSSSRGDAVVNQVVWALGNIAGDCTTYRNMVLEHGVVQSLFVLFQENRDISILRNATWMLSNLCRGKPKAPLESITPLLSVTTQLLEHPDEGVRGHACWTVCYFADGDVTYKQRIINAGIVPKLVQRLLDPASEVKTPALRATGNILAGNNLQTQVVVDSGVIAPLGQLLHERSKSLRKDACWAICNIAAGTPAQIQSVIEGNLITPVLQLATSADFDIRKEAAWVLCNAISGGEKEQKYELARLGCVNVIPRLLDFDEPKLLGKVLHAIKVLLHFGRNSLNSNAYVNILEELGGKAKLERLQLESNGTISQKAGEILESFYPSDSDFDTANDPVQTMGAPSCPGGFLFST